MKLTRIVAVAFLAISVMACKPSTEKKETTISSEESAMLVTSKIDIEGMTCEIGCAKTIESKVAKLEGVSESKVDFEAKKGTFTYDSNKISEEKIISSINNLLDGNTYTAAHAKSCKLDSKDACCVLKEKQPCSKQCAEKCEHKEGESCTKKCDTSVKKECKVGDEKACCKVGKKECKPDCEKPCCKTKKEECKSGSEKACCKVEKKQCKSDGDKASCADKK